MKTASNSKTNFDHRVFQKREMLGCFSFLSKDQSSGDILNTTCQYVKDSEFLKMAMKLQCVFSLVIRLKRSKSLKFTLSSSN